MNMIPLGDRVLIRPAERPTQTESGIQLAEHRKPDTAGWVVGVGEGTHRNPCVAVGDYVLFSWQSGQEFWMDDERLLIMRESDLLAVIEEEVVNG